MKKNYETTIKANILRLNLKAGKIYIQELTKGDQSYVSLAAADEYYIKEEGRKDFVLCPHIIMCGKEFQIFSPRDNIVVVL